jgi:RNA polymerase sigma factor (sigma-70 family)
MATMAALCPAPAGTDQRPTFAELYVTARKYLLPRRRYFFSVDRADLEDLVHDTVLVANQIVDRYEVRPGANRESALGRWLFVIAWHLAARHSARRALHRALPPAPSFVGPDPEALAVLAQRRRLLVRVLRGVRAERARVLILHEGGDLSAPEIARALGIKENTVKSRISRAIQDARRAMRRLTPSELLLLQEVVDR